MTSPRFLSSLPLQHPSPAVLGTCTVALPADWPLTHGGQLTDAEVAFELCGPAEAPVVAVLGGISAGRHATATADDPSPGWWQPIVGSGRAIDTRRYRVLSLDFLGGNGATSGPRACPPGISPETFPAISSFDQANALALVLDTLGISRLHALVGASYGGMVGLAFAARFGERLERLAVISAAHRSHPQATAWRSLQRQIVRLGLRRAAAAEGLALSRALAMVTYRSPAVLAAGLAGSCRLEEIDSLYGHDAFLKEIETLGAIVAGALAGTTFEAGRV